MFRRERDQSKNETKVAHTHALGKSSLEFRTLLPIQEFREIEEIRKSKSRLSYAEWLAKKIKTERRAERRAAAEESKALDSLEGLRRTPTINHAALSNNILQQHEAIVSSRRRESMHAFDMWCVVQDAALTRAMQERETAQRQEELKRQRQRMEEMQRDAAVLESIASAIKADTSKALMQDLQSRGLDVHLGTKLSSLRHSKRSVYGRRLRRSAESGRVREVAWGLLDLQVALEEVTRSHSVARPQQNLVLPELRHSESRAGLSMNPL